MDSYHSAFKNPHDLNGQKADPATLPELDLSQPLSPKQATVQIVPKRVIGWGLVFFGFGRCQMNDLATYWSGVSIVGGRLRWTPAWQI